MKSFIINIFLLVSCFSFAQNGNEKSLDELINVNDSAINLINDWAKKATVKVEILENDKSSAAKNLLWAQVSTRSSMGAIIYETGGIVIENGLLRIYGSGCQKLNRSIMDWNSGRAVFENNIPKYILIADDIFGGFYAINGGFFSNETLSKIYYFSPDTLQWENLNINYSDFILFSFSTKINQFLNAFKWETFDTNFNQSNYNQAFSFYPFLFTIEGKNIEKVDKKLVSVDEIWKLYNDLQK